MDETVILRLLLRDFRNFGDVDFSPSPSGLTVIQGENGAGKSSLLEAVVYASTLQSFRGAPREAIVRRQAVEANVRCDVLAGKRRVEVEIAITPGRRDRAWHNAQRVPGTRGLLEVLRTTLFTPDDLMLVKGAPSGRRDFLDDVLAKAHPRLGADRAGLDRVLRHRNALLRQLGGRLDSEAATTLDIWDERLAQVGERLACSRAQLVEQLSPYAAEAFSVLAAQAGSFEMRYVRSWDGTLSDALATARREDLRRATTTVGPQRDELEIDAGGLDARTRLSQGRQRCVALALRLASHRLMSAVTDTAPVLLLDDAFSELDEGTARALVSQLPDGQALLTTAGELPPGATPKLVVRLADGRLEL
ncbi:MAG: DNA replication and repair protein RecF [Acidimicrobiales bacterium]|jgi:DNA replication and repair protein RecF